MSDNINRAPIQKLRKILQEQAQFYVDQLNHRDYRGQEKQSSWMRFKDYSVRTPGLQIIDFKTQGTFIASHPKGLTSFENEDDLFDFLIDVLGYSQEQLSKGSTNVISIDKVFRPEVVLPSAKNVLKIGQEIEQETEDIEEDEEVELGGEG